MIIWDSLRKQFVLIEDSFICPLSSSPLSRAKSQQSALFQFIDPTVF